MPDEYFYQEQGAEIGPIAWNDLKWLADSGRLDRNALVRKGRTGKWLLAKRIKGLIDLSAKPITSPKPANENRVAKKETESKDQQPPAAPADSLPAHLLPRPIQRQPSPAPPQAPSNPETAPPKKVKRIVPIDDLLPPSAIPKSPPNR